MSNILIAYFSMSGETYADGTIVNLDKGFTNIAADYIHDAIGGEMFHIEQVREYSQDHFQMIEEAKRELRDHETPELKAYIGSIADFDTIVLMYPNWWNTLPMPVVTFLTKYDLSGKRIIPFNTSGGGGFGKSIEAIKQYAPKAEVADGLTVVGTKVTNSKKLIQEWAVKNI